MSSSRPARQRHSTVFYRDEQFEKPTIRRSLPATLPAPIPLASDDYIAANIPEVLIAPDGRKFFPCKYCCKAFAFKKAQISHIKFCGLKDAARRNNEKVTPINQKLHKVEVSVFCCYFFIVIMVHCVFS